MGGVPRPAGRILERVHERVAVRRVEGIGGVVVPAEAPVAVLRFVGAGIEAEVVIPQRGEPVLDPGRVVVVERDLLVRLVDLVPLVGEDVQGGGDVHGVVQGDRALLGRGQGDFVLLLMSCEPHSVGDLSHAVAAVGLVPVDLPVVGGVVALVPVEPCVGGEWVTHLAGYRARLRLPQIGFLGHHAQQDVRRNAPASGQLRTREEALRIDRAQSQLATPVALFDPVGTEFAPHGHVHRPLDLIRSGLKSK